MIYVINSPVITNFGSYDYKPTDVLGIRQLLSDQSFTSAVGHEETATLLTRLLGFAVPFNRITVKQEAGDIFIVIKPTTRLEINKVNSDVEIEEIGYELGVLTRIK